MKRNGQVHAQELLLRVQIGQIGDHPPAIDVGVNVPNDMLMVQHVFGIGLLQETRRSGRAPASSCSR